MNWKAIVGIIVSSIFLYFAFRGADIDLLLGALGEADYRLLIPVILLMLLSMLFRAMRWRIFLRSIKKISLWSLFSAAAIGLMANNLLPARLGEFVRAYVIGEKENISKSASLATIIVERVFDGLTVLTFLGIILLFDIFSFPALLQKAAWLTVVFYGLTIVFLILLRIRTDMALAVVSFLVKPLPKKIGEKIVGLSDSFVDGLKVMDSGWQVFSAMLLSFLVWLPNIVVIWLLFISFGFSIPAYASLVLFVILTIGIMIPSAPGFVGTIQYCCVLGLGWFSVPDSQALSYSIVYHAGVFIPITGAGLICLAIEGLSFSDIKRR